MVEIQKTHIQNSTPNNNVIKPANDLAKSLFGIHIRVTYHKTNRRSTLALFVQSERMQGQVRRRPSNFWVKINYAAVTLWGWRKDVVDVRRVE